MRETLLKLLMSVSLCWGVTGCVTANQLEVPLTVKEFGKEGKINDCYLMTIERKSVSQQGHWWVVQGEKNKPGVPIKVSVRIINSGDKISQAGHRITLWGPYARGHVHSYEYWLYKDGFQPRSFTDMKLGSAKKRKKPASLSIEKTDYVEDYSNEHVLDGARALATTIENGLFPLSDQTGMDLLLLVINQATKAKHKTMKPRRITEAKEVLKILNEAITQTNKPIVPAKN